ncbi:phage tail protein [Collimonas sp.]|jgi:hypothetical protein|uniref:phage tail-collar fiber domain-containing protein n=1 Tax=Collimonas sp. TaxID=1963772 RepID=UPI002D146B6F|nr:phage tail protein [Collimonas sp.]HWX02384.1 phage tail protein [Collimonas sp.]
MSALNTNSALVTAPPRTNIPTITGAGVMAAINVAKTGIEVSVTHIAFGTGKYRPNGTETGLQHEMMRVAIAGGGKVSPTQLQVHAEAIAPAGSSFWCGEIGFYAGDTLFAVYSKPDQPILYFADDSVTTVSYTLGLAALPADSVTVLVDPNVNTAIQLIGAHETADDPHPQYLTKLRGDAIYVKKSGDAMGALSVASGKADPTYSAYAMEIREATRATDSRGRDISYAPKMIFHWGGVCVTQMRLTADNVLEVVGGDGASYGALQVGSINATASMTLGGKSVWHQGNFDPASKQDKLPFTPVQQGTGIGQKSNVVKIGWNGENLKVTVDDIDMGAVIFQANLELALKNYLSLAGGSVTGLLRVSGSTGAIGSLGPGQPCIEVASSGKSDDAYMTFHKPGTYATHLGLDANNDLAVGGYSMGANAYKLWHAGNLNPASKQDALGYRPSQAVGNWLNSVIVDDSRTKNYAPEDRDMGVYFDFRNNDADGLGDGGTQHGIVTFRQWGVGGDFSGGPAHQLGFTANGNVFHRTGKSNAWEKYQRLLKAGQNGTLPDGYMPTATDLNVPPLGWALYTQEATANRPSAYGHVFTSSLTGSATPANGNWLMQRALSTDNQVLTRVNIGAGQDKWSAWLQGWTSGNFNPADKVNGRGISLNWAGREGQPTWVHGGDAADNCGVYNPRNWHVRYADAAGHAQTAGNANTVGGMSVRFAENPADRQPYYLLGVFAGGPAEATLINRTALAVGSAVTAVYAHQLTGQGLQHGGVGGYIFNKSKSGTGLTGIWEQRGQAYDYGSGAVEGNESSGVLWQRIA